MPFVALEREHAVMEEELQAAFTRVLSRSAFILGEEVERFEEEWAATCATAHCVGTASGTAALTLLLRAAGIGPGDEVIVPAHTFIASALAVVHAGAVPVLCDVEEATGLIDVDAAAAAISARTAAILCVHLYGQICDVTALRRLADAHGVVLLEDAAHAHGAEFDGRSPGTFGTGAAFSFYPSKNLGALGDAGAICTNDARLAERARRLRNLGQRRKGEHVEIGDNQRLDGLQAALLRTKLPWLAADNAVRRRHAAHYRATLEDTIRLLHVEPRALPVYHVFPIRVTSRDAVANHLRAAGIEVGVHYSPALHDQPALRHVIAPGNEYPRAQAWAEEELSLPLFPSLGHDEIERVVASCHAAVAAVESSSEPASLEGGVHA